MFWLKSGRANGHSQRDSNVICPSTGRCGIALRSKTTDSVTSGLQTVEICCHSGLAETLAAGQLEVADGIDEEWQRALTHEGIGANFDVHRVMAQQEANPFVHTPKPRRAGIRIRNVIRDHNSGIVL